jgi:hypothetical protein
MNDDIKIDSRIGSDDPRISQWLTRGSTNDSKLNPTMSG